MSGELRNLVREVRNAHPCLGPIIGRGGFCTVFGDRCNPARVYKLTCDPATVCLHFDPQRPRGRHFPKGVKYCDTFDFARSSYHLFLTERLKPVTSSQVSPLARWLVARYRDYCTTLRREDRRLRRQWRVGVRALHALMEELPVHRDRSLAASLSSLARFAERFETPLAFEVRHLMRRDTTFVFNDIVVPRELC
mgnify:CR=1 FL=1